MAAADVIVVGGGSAGCVLASRLTEDDERSVVLLEAGPDHQAAADLPADVADASEPTLEHDWGFIAEPDRLGRTIELPRGRIMGGCSATNGCFAVRGAPADYDRWASLGNPGWSFAEVLPYFRRLEADADFDDEWHGVDGPVPIHRLRRDEMNEVQRSFLDAAVDNGHAAVEDHNRPGAVGAGPNPRNVRDGIRMSTALTYLAAARPRRNLEIRSETVVDRVEVRGSRAVGVRLVGGELIEAGEVVLAAGAYASPTVLARSGIGPADHLRPLGIEVVAALSGVGENLIDHALLPTDLPARHRATGPRYQALTTLRSEGLGLDAPPDLHLLLAGPFDATSDASPTGAVFAIVAGLMAPRSKGWVRLRSVDPLDRPSIHIGHLTALEDVDLLVEATLVARQLARLEPLADCIDGPELTPGPDIADDDYEGLVRSARERVSSYHHPVGTCRMGPDPDDGAVVDSRGRVHGIEGLRVCDASIMPTIPSANTNLPTIMVAERISAWLREA